MCSKSLSCLYAAWGKIMRKETGKEIVAIPHQITPFPANLVFWAARMLALMLLAQEE